jgi:hypothetical protein
LCWMTAWCHIVASLVFPIFIRKTLTKMYENIHLSDLPMMTIFQWASSRETIETISLDVLKVTISGSASLRPFLMVAISRFASSKISGRIRIPNTGCWSNYSHLMASWRWRGVILFTFRSLEALPANSSTCIYNMSCLINQSTSVRYLFRGCNGCIFWKTPLSLRGGGIFADDNVIGGKI